MALKHCPVVSEMLLRRWDGSMCLTTQPPSAEPIDDWHKRSRPRGANVHEQVKARAANESPRGIQRLSFSLSEI